MSDQGALAALLQRQSAERDGLIASYEALESELYEPATSSNYESLSSTERTAYTKKLNELKKSREELVANLKSAKERVKMTKELLAEDASDESYTAPQTRNSSSVRIPTLPSFRGTEKGAIDDAFDFLDKCKYIFEDNLVPKDRCYRHCLQH